MTVHNLVLSTDRHVDFAYALETYLIYPRIRDGDTWRAASTRPGAVLATVTLTGAGAASVVASLPVSPALPAYWSFAVLGVGLAIIDIRRRRLPYVLTGTALIVHLTAYSAAAASTGDVNPLVRVIGAGLAATTAMLIIALTLPGQLGLGDVALTGGIAASLGPLGWPTLFHGILSALLGQAIAAIVLRSTSGQALPMGPALIAGWLTAILLHSM